MRRISALKPTNEENAVFLASVPKGYSGPSSFELDSELARLETHLVASALRQTRGNRAQAARILGIKRTRLVEMLKRKCAAIYASNTATQNVAVK